MRVDDHDLLGVLLAEVGPLGADEREEDGHHRGDALEVARARGTLQRPGDGADADASCRSPAGRPPRRSGSQTMSTPSASQMREVAAVSRG